MLATPRQLLTHLFPSPLGEYFEEQQFVNVF
jgi:hypothetical protein